MQNAKLFQNGQSQAVRLPKLFRMPGKEVRIHKSGNRIILEPLEDSCEGLFKSLDEFPDDFMEDGRRQPPVRERKTF